MILKKLREAQEEILGLASVTAKTVKISIPEAFTRILAEEVTAGFSVPPFDTSAMDGFAVKSADLENAEGENGSVRLKVTGELAAGSQEKFTVRHGTAIKIMTGAPLPEGADSILVKENATEERNGTEWNVSTASKATRGLHVRKAGTDFSKGEVIMKAGTFLGHAAIGMLASAARREVMVYEKPSISVLSTGDELIDPFDPVTQNAGFEPPPGKIMNSNLYLLSTLISASGAVPSPAGIAPDTPEGIAGAISDGLAKAGVVITTGGASVGSYDFIPDALKLLGFTVNIWKMDMKPGRPFIFGYRGAGTGREFVFGLPGNPASSMVSFLKLIRPVIYKIAGRSDPLATLEVTAKLATGVKADPERTTFVRARIVTRDGETVVETSERQDSNILSSALALNCLAEIPPGRGILTPGTAVRAQII